MQLFFDFNPTGNRDQLFVAGTDFNTQGVMANFQTDPRKPLSLFSQVRVGQFYNGQLRQLIGRLDYRYHQYANISMNYQLNQIKLGEGFDGGNILLIGPRIDLTFTNSLFWTTFVQYNTQFDNLNINSRLQWRFRPVSDLFIVYTDNYFPDTFMVKNRALVAKLTYWMNL